MLLSIVTIFAMRYGIFVENRMIFVEADLLVMLSVLVYYVIMCMSNNTDITDGKKYTSNTSAVSGEKYE